MDRSFDGIPMVLLSSWKKPQLKIIYHLQQNNRISLSLTFMYDTSFLKIRGICTVLYYTASLSTLQPWKILILFTSDFIQFIIKQQAN